MFARSRRHPAKILSVEPDPQCLSLLKRTVDLNGGSDIDWQIVALAVSDTSGRISIPLSNWFYELALMEGDGPGEIEVESTTLVDLVAGRSWQPDIIKIDTDPFEHEIICPALSLFERLRPALQLEVHWAMLAARIAQPRTSSPLSPTWATAASGAATGTTTPGNVRPIGGRLSDGPGAVMSADRSLSVAARHGHRRAPPGVATVAETDIEHPKTRRRRWFRRAIGDRPYWWLRFAYRLPVYRRMEQSLQLRMRLCLSCSLFGRSLS